MKFTINHEDALKLQQRISKTKGSNAITDVTIRVNTDGSTDLFATNGAIMGAYFAKKETDQEEIDFETYPEEVVFTVDLRPLQKLKKMIQGVVRCEYDGKMLHMTLNHFKEELVLKTGSNNIFDKFLDILNYDNYTSDFNGETFIDTEQLSKVAFGEEVRLQRGIEDTSKFLITDADYRYRGVILGKTIIEEEPEKDDNPVEGLPFDKEMEYYEKATGIIKEKYEELAKYKTEIAEFVIHYVKKGYNCQDILDGEGHYFDDKDGLQKILADLYEECIKTGVEEFSNIYIKKED